MLLLLCLSSILVAEAVTPIPGSKLTGTLLPDGFIRYLAWPRLLQETESVYSQWCASRKIGDDSTVMVAFRTNRCISTSLGPGTGLLQMVNAPGSPTQLFMFAQANSSHFELAMCPTNTCDSGCTHDVGATPGCFTSSFSATGSTTVGVVISPSWVAEAPALPSPLYCFRIVTDPSCIGGEMLVTGCVAQCTPIDDNSFTFTSCVPGTRAVELSNCPYDPAAPLTVLSAYGACKAATRSQPCPNPGPASLPGADGACATIRGGLYGFQTASCTVSNDNVLHPHPCAGLADVRNVRCNPSNDQDVSVDGSVVNRIAGSWVSAATRLQVREPRVGTVPFNMRGDWSPNAGALELSFASKSSIELNTPIVLATFSSAVTARSFSSVSVVAADSTDQFCATPVFQPTSMSVLVSQGQCSTGLSTGAIAGIAVGAVVLVIVRFVDLIGADAIIGQVAAVVAAIVGSVMRKRKNEQFLHTLSPRAEYTKM